LKKEEKPPVKRLLAVGNDLPLRGGPLPARSGQEISQ
jgi:hypothetical protein